MKTPPGGSDQILVRVLPCAGCGYPFDHELLGKYGCPNCEGNLAENRTKQKIQKNAPYCRKGQSDGKPAKQGKTTTNRKPVCYNSGAMKTNTIPEKCQALSELPKYKQRHKWETVKGSKAATERRGIWTETLRCIHCGCEFTAECTKV
ncbi:MAG: hypothetical protein O3A92_15955 [Verrucomicrobia bacterium]|nr:hypothetical protein [Verrucomicrobiota bacterium]